jgi:hypothetical protein
LTNPANAKGFRPALTGGVLLVLGLLLWAYGYSGMTPASVSVSGYYRSDGTYVSSYERRPQGSVPHDEPYHGVEWLGVFMTCVGGYFILRRKKLAIDSQHSYLTHARPKPVPETPKVVPVPTGHGISKEQWRCDYCDRPFGANEIYWFNENSMLSDDCAAYCSECRDKLVLENRARKSNQLLTSASMSQRPKTNDPQLP